MVSVLITTYNSASVLEACLQSLRAQTYRPLEVIVVDNASTDLTCNLLSKWRSEVRVLYNETNTGFSAAQNLAARCAKGQWLLSLNPDVVLCADFVEKLVEAGELHPMVGTVCGKLLRWQPGANPEFTDTIDSTGIYFQPDLRHLDRGAGEKDGGQFDRLEYVFGATGAAALYRRSMLEDISVDGEYFDEQFFAYREDADLAWRAQLMGWECVYTPRALGWHVRRVTPERRQQLPHEINWHSIKNRFLMRAKNIGWPLYRSLLLAITRRDAQVIGYCLLKDRMFASALLAVWKARREISRKREKIQARRRVRDQELIPWFSQRPVSVPLILSTETEAKRAYLSG
jgi:GT2 family glycosyltransferase